MRRVQEAEAKRKELALKKLRLSSDSIKQKSENIRRFASLID